MHFPSFNVWLAIYLAHDLAFLMLPVDVCVNFEDWGLIICYSGFKWPFFFVIYRPVYSYDRQTHKNLEINRRKSTNVWITKIFFFFYTPPWSSKMSRAIIIHRIARCCIPRIFASYALSCLLFRDIAWWVLLLLLLVIVRFYCYY